MTAALRAQFGILEVENGATGLASGSCLCAGYLHGSYQSRLSTDIHQVGVRRTGLQVMEDAWGFGRSVPAGFCRARPAGPRIHPAPGELSGERSNRFVQKTTSSLNSLPNIFRLLTSESEANSAV